MSLLRPAWLSARQSLKLKDRFLGEDTASARWSHERTKEMLCARTGCQYLKRTRSSDIRIPFYEGKDVCSRECLQALIEMRLRHELAAQPVSGKAYQHRMPIGLLMLSLHWITREQLMETLALQRKEGYGRFGEWLVASGVCDEATVTRAVARQLGVPVLNAADDAQRAIRLVPKLLSDAFHTIPVRIAANRILYVAVEQKIELSLNNAVESMTGMRVESVVLPATLFSNLLDQMSAVKTRERIFHAATLNGLRDSILSILDERASSNIQLAVLKEYIWLRVLRAGAKSPEKLKSRTDDCIFRWDQSELN